MLSHRAIASGSPAPPHGEGAARVLLPSTRRLWMEKAHPDDDLDPDQFEGLADSELLSEKRRRENRWLLTR
jgi:hypothetical protein